ncbi:MAG: hypothetical protein JNL74_06395 [Fibrobacteres bacterium]|nr:hypothetical protein [Fibrobacterota bacterium]
MVKKVSVIALTAAVILLNGCSKKSPIAPEKAPTVSKQTSLYNTDSKLPPGTPIEFSLFLESSEKVHFCFRERDVADTFVYMLIADGDTIEGTFANDFNNASAITLPQGKSVYVKDVNHPEAVAELKVFLRRQHEGNGTIGLLAEAE